MKSNKHYLCHYNPTNSFILGQEALCRHYASTCLCQMPWFSKEIVSSIKVKSTLFLHTLPLFPLKAKPQLNHSCLVGPWVFSIFLAFSEFLCASPPPPLQSFCLFYLLSFPGRDDFLPLLFPTIAPFILFSHTVSGPLIPYLSKNVFIELSLWNKVWLEVKFRGTRHFSSKLLKYYPTNLATVWPMRSLTHLYLSLLGS